MWSGKSEDSLSMWVENELLPPLPRVGSTICINWIVTADLTIHCSSRFAYLSAGSFADPIATISLKVSQLVSSLKPVALLPKDYRASPELSWSRTLYTQ
jgi:hypothetical protein